jgi:pimeloyl-ACP methyl ester carboxylesterase
VGVQAAVNPPFAYQWFKDGSSLSGQTGGALSLASLSIADSGLYSVVVSNSYSSATSLAAKLEVYAGPPPLQLALPTISTTTADSTSPIRLAAMTALPPSTGALYLYNSTTGSFGAGVLDPNKPTVVLTHGWNSSPEEWPKNVAQALVRKGYSLNIVAWQWVVGATIDVLDPSPSANRTPAEGVALGKSLLAQLGPAYNHQLHFIGHSLGTMVNCASADFLHGDGLSQSTKNAGAYLPSNTSLTLLDEAKLVTAVKGIRVFFEILRAGSGGLLGDSNATANDAAYTLRNFWSKVIPTQHGFIDNYVSEVGLLYEGATNVMLYRSALLDDPIAAHSEAYDWYARSIEDARAITVGYNWSRTTPPTSNTYFNQSFDPDPANEFTLTQMVGDQAVRLRFVIYPSLQAVQQLTNLGNYVEGVYLSTIQATGVAAASFVSTFGAAGGSPVYLGTAGSTPAFFAPSGAVQQSSQAQWNLQLILQGQGVTPSASQLVTGPFTTQAVATPDASTSPQVGANANFVVMPIHVPLEAVGMTFEYQLSGVAAGDFMTVCIGDKSAYTMEADYVRDGEWNGVPMCQMSDYRDHEIDLTFTLNGRSAPSAGSLSVRNIQFYIPKRPELGVGVMAGNQTQLSWPLSGIDWTVEATNDISNPNSWVPVNGIPTDINYSHTMNLDTTGQSRLFFRLKKTAAP